MSGKTVPHTHLFFADELSLGIARATDGADDERIVLSFSGQVGRNPRPREVTIAVPIRNWADIQRAAAHSIEDIREGRI